MEKQVQIGMFYQVIADDPRIRSSHVCIYLTLVFLMPLNEATVSVNGDLMERFSKLEKKTCLKCIRDLSAYGYLYYFPSFDPDVKSKVCIKEIM